MKILILLIFWSLWFLNASTRMVLSPLLPIIEDELTITHALAGSLFFYMSVGATISVFMSGWISRHLGYKRSVIYSFTTLALVLLCLRYAHTYDYSAVFYFLMGLASGIYLPCAIPLITSLFSRDHWGKAIGFHDTAASSSFLAMPILVALLLRFYYWKSIFVILSGACMMLVIFFWVLVPDPHPQEARNSRYSNVLRRKEFWIMAILWTIAATAATGVYSIIPLFLVKEKGIQLELANTIFGFSRIGGVFATILVGFLLDRYDVKRILLLILLITGLSTVGMALAQALWLLVGMLAIQATTSVVFFPSAITAISTITPFKERSTFMGVILAISTLLSIGFVPVGLGALADRWSFQVGIFMIGVLTLLSCVLVRGVKKMVDPFEPDPL
jgi:NNP family nitrate/nitrite transporter-like MFS transporter